MKKSDSYLKDPFYKDTFSVFKTEEDVVNAGWFDDNFSEQDYNIELFTTPFGKISRNLAHNKENKPIAILLTTGGFAPLHQGHLSMMELSKDKLEEEGYFVAGGYFSTSHDSYVCNKYNQSITTCAEERNDQINQQIYNSPWLLNDPWESLFTQSAINFTRVYDRLYKYLELHLGVKFKLFYIYGSDNYNFHKAFILKGQACCVERSTSAINGPIINDRIFYIKNNHNSVSYSSSYLRKQPLSNDFKKSDLPYLIRDDSSHFSHKLKYHDFLVKLEEIIKLYSGCSTITVDAKDQQEWLNKLTHPYINLDKVTKSKNKIETSRIFDFSDSQISPHLLSIKFKDIDFNQSYFIVDDDIASGKTMEFIKKQIPNLKVSGEISLAQTWFENRFNRPYHIYDIVDLRDFVFGSPDGGLFVNLKNNKFGRLPYIYPFVNLTTRAKIDPKFLKYFSKKIIDLNLELYKDSALKLKDCDLLFVEAMTQQGFNLNDLMLDLCVKIKKHLYP